MELLVAYAFAAFILLLIAGSWAGMEYAEDEKPNHWDAVAVALLWPVVVVYICGFVFGCVLRAVGAVAARLITRLLTPRQAA